MSVINFLKWISQRPEVVLLSTFLGLAVIGTVLLKLPVAHAPGVAPVSWLDAFFTATSAVCVTGLITIDTASIFSKFGQGVILGLIQVGALGVITFGTLAGELLRLRISFGSQAVLRDTLFGDESIGGLRRAVRMVLVVTALLEGLGAVLIYIGLNQADVDVPHGWFEATFISISAFCNAGFSVYSDSLISVRGAHLAIGTVMLLIVLGGLGYVVLLEMLHRMRRQVRRQRGRPVNWTLHSRVVLGFSGMLIGGGAVLLLLTGLAAPELTWIERFEHALFQSITARTAGFNTLQIGQLPLASLLVIIPLMLIGGSPGSAAGGVKTTSTAIWIARIRARLSNREEVVLANRRLPDEVVRRAALVLSLAVLWNLFGVLLLVVLESDHPDIRFEDIIFEQVSAFATVGLSTGLTPLLSWGGKLWIIASMFVGRLGPLTLAVAVLPRYKRPRYTYPHERLMIG